MNENINHEQAPEFSIPSSQRWRELDDLPFTLNDDEKTFLHKTIDDNENLVKARVEAVRKSAFSHYPYPCIRRFHFINLMMMQNPAYPAIVEAGRKGDTWFLDIGCCMGTDARKLVLDGYPAVNIAGCDLRSTFLDIGSNELFRDAGSCEISFFTADIFDVRPTKSYAEIISLIGRTSGSLRDALQNSYSSKLTDAKLKLLKGRLNHIYAGALFHLFDEPTQYDIALRIVSLLKNASGSIIFGRHEGKEEAGDIDDGVIGASTFRYGHNAVTWVSMWQRAYEEIEGTEYTREHVRVRAEFVENNNGLTNSWLVWSVSHV